MTNRKQLTKSQIKFLDMTASETQGATCACCTKTYKIWYVESIQIGRVYCACEAVPAEANALGVLPYAMQIAD